MKKRSVSYKKTRRRITWGVILTAVIVFVGIKTLEWNQAQHYDSLYDKTENDLSEIERILLSNDVLKMRVSDWREDILVSQTLQGDEIINYRQKKETYYREVLREFPVVLEDGREATRREMMRLKFEFVSPEGSISDSNYRIKLKMTVDGYENKNIFDDATSRGDLEPNNLAINEMMIDFRYDEEEFLRGYDQCIFNKYYFKAHEGLLPEWMKHANYLGVEDKENPVIIKWDENAHNSLNQVGDYYEVEIELLPGTYSSDRDKVENLIRHAQMDIYLHVENDTILANYFGKDKYDDFIKFTKKFEYIN